MADIHGMPSESMMVPVQGMDIQAPMEDLSAMSAAAQAAALARQPEALAILESPQGAGLDGLDVLAGGTAGWAADVMPSSDPDNGGYGGA